MSKIKYLDSKYRIYILALANDGNEAIKRVNKCCSIWTKKTNYDWNLMKLDIYVLTAATEFFFYPGKTTEFKKFSLFFSDKINEKSLNENVCFSEINHLESISIWKLIETHFKKFALRLFFFSLFFSILFWQHWYGCMWYRIECLVFIGKIFSRLIIKVSYRHKSRTEILQSFFFLLFNVCFVLNAFLDRLKWTISFHSS